LPNGPTDKLIKLLAKGLPFGLFNTLSDKTGIPALELASILSIPARTLARRKSTGRLAPDESERLIRFAHIFEKTVELFEGRIRPAVNWLRSPKKALSNHSPFEYISFEIGAREVESLIGRLEHGAFS
jgi:putative toxin-antitoxin system antitoxin component (TIGR02293 family)